MVKDEFMKLAESIIGSSRHTELNKKILSMGNIAQDENYWLKEVFSGLAYKTFNAMFHLKA